MVNPLFPRINSIGVPHVRPSVRGLTETGRSRIKGLSFLLTRHHQRSGTRSLLLRMDYFFSESHMKFINATNRNRKSGGMKWRDLQCALSLSQIR